MAFRKFTLCTNTRMAVKEKTKKSTKGKEPVDGEEAPAPAKPSAINAMLADERTPRILGLASMFLGLLIGAAMFSYLFTWEKDQSSVLEFSWGMIFNSDVTVDNMLGRFGAVLSHQFYYNLFGVASWAIVGMLVSIGLKWGFGIPMQLGRIFKYGFLCLVYFSVAFAFVFQVMSFPWGGAFGRSVSEWLMEFMGMVGTAALLGFGLLAYVVFKFNYNPGNLIPIKVFNKMAGANAANAKNRVPGFEYEDDDTDVKNWTKKIETENDELNAVEEEMTEGEVDLPWEVDTKEEEPEEDGPLDFDIITPTTTAAAAATTTTVPGLSFEVNQPETPHEEVVPEEEVALEVNEVIEEKEAGEIFNDLGEYDPTLDLRDFQFPPLDLLRIHGSEKILVDTEELEKNKNQIVETLQNYNIEISKIKATIGPTVTLYEIVPAAGVRISKIKNLEDDIALSLAALGIRIIAPIPGKGTIGIEVPNVKKEVVSMHSLIASEKFQNSKAELPIVIGKTIANEIFTTDLAKMPHLLMAGATGQGKSVGLNAILVSLLYKKHPSQLKFVLVDPKKVELTLYSLIEKHYLAKLPGEEEAIITDTKKVIHTLNALCIEMDNRYDLLKEAQVRNIKEYNAKFVARRLNPNKGHQFLPYIVLVVDEFADLMMTAGKEVETPIARLAQLARAIGIHLIIATQRPSVNIITGTIKANFPARVAFKVTSKIDSRTILDGGGADQLIGRGDMLLSEGGEMIRLQCGFVDTPEVEDICKFIGQQRGYSEAFRLPEYVDEKEEGAASLDIGERDSYFEDAARILVQTQQGSTSLLQRRLKLGYNRAGRVMDQLEQAGIVGPSQGSKAREVLYPDLYQLEQFLNDLS
jgi:DNA segregation ATPase FtsK/SpoIIIE, S-DNA-T family